MSYRIDWTQGSSPLTRGKQPARLASWRAVGLIPAHAGKTLRRPRRRQQRGAHPRSRGENTRNHKLGLPSKGSSPLTRGKRGFVGGHAGGRGLIPAHAGKTKMLRCSSASSAAHPRSRGENPSWQRTRSRSPGSSPLTRGKQPLAKTGAFDKGLIPAHAGKTLTCVCDR